MDRALGLDDRLSAAARAGGDAPPASLEALRPWVQAFCPDDPGALARRLEWDGLELATVLRAVADPLPPVPVPAWTAWLPRFQEAAAAVAAEGTAATDPALPFAPLWAAVSRAGRAELERRGGPAGDALAPAALDALERQLRHEAAILGEQAAHDAFRAALDAEGAAPDPASSRVHDAFVRRTLAGGLAGLFAGHPVLARLLGVLAESWVESTAELVSRLRADAEALAEVFSPGTTPLGPAVSAVTGLGDRHHGGRRVTALAFASGTRVVYKPREVGLEAAFALLLAWLRGLGLEVPRPLKAIDRGAYGFVEVAERGAFVSGEEVKRYYRQAGALLCLAYVLRGRDLHMENLVASREGPQLVDTEMLLQPEAASDGPAPGAVEGEGPGLQDSVLGSGLLSFVERDGAGRPFDVGGLRGTGGGRAPVARRRWEGLGTDAIRFLRDPRFEPTLGNRVLLEGVDQPPEAFAGEVVDGFRAAYRLLLERREALSSPGGPVARFAGRPVRVLFRTSTQYGALQYVLTAPAYQASGLRRSFALEALNRNLSHEMERPAIWPLIADERRALEGLDIPRFTLPSDATEVRAGSGEAVTGHFRRSGYEAVRARLRSLSEEDLAFQEGLLVEALGQGVDSRFSSPPPASGEAADEGALLDDARWIGRELLARAIAEGPSLTWPVSPFVVRRGGAARHHLYDGSTGPVLFLSALFAATGEAPWREAALRAAQPARAFLEAPGGARDLGPGEPIGGAGGLASVAYAFAVAGRLLGDDSLLDAAVRFARLVTPDRIRSDRRLDVVSGAAGAALAILAVREVSGEEWLTGRAAACARHLLDTAEALPGGGRAWPAADGRLLAGFGHGAAGIALALARLSAATGDGRLLAAARDAYGYERSLFSAAHGNWPVVGHDRRAPGRGARLMAAWCHGAPGVAIARVLARPVLDDDEVGGEIEAASATTVAAARAGGDHLCCGALGRVDALLLAGEREGRPEWTAAARTLAEAVAGRARDEGRYALPSGPFEYLAFHPGFFKGLSGIGYGLLRAAAPSRVPSVLGFEAPVRPGDHR